MDLEPAAASEAGWAALPEPILLSVYAMLPLDSRACAACVCRHWRLVSNDRSLWRHVDFTALHDTRARGASSLDYARLCSAARCVGVLETLDASALHCPVYTHSTEQLLRLHAATLRVLRLPACADIFSSPSPTNLRRLVAAGPALQVLEAPCEVTRLRDAVGALALPPPLHLSGLHVWLPSTGLGEEGVTSWPDFCAALARQPLRRLSLANVNVYGEEPFASALRAAGVRRLELREVLPDDDLDGQPLAPDPPELRGRHLGSYLRAAPLTHLLLKASYFISHENKPYFSTEAARALAPALSAAPALRTLELLDTALFHCRPTAVALLAACTGHPMLRMLNVSEVEPLGLDRQPLDDDDAVQVGAALEALVLSPATRLRSLFLSDTRLGEAAVAPLVAALPRAPRLRRLGLAGCSLSPAFCAEVLLPAARAAPRLLQLTTTYEREANPAAAEAEDLALSRMHRHEEAFLPFNADGDDDMPTDDEEAWEF